MPKLENYELWLLHLWGILKRLQVLLREGLIFRMGITETLGVHMEIGLINKEISLEKLQQKHAQDVFALVVKNRQHLKEYMPWAERTTELRHTMEFINACLHVEENNGAFNCCVFYQGELVGLCGFHALDKENRKASLGYWIDKDHAGRGITSTVVDYLSRYAFEKMNIHRMEIRCATENRPSQKVAEKAGYRQEARLKQVEWLRDHFVDHFVYSQFSTVSFQ